MLNVFYIKDNSIKYIKGCIIPIERQTGKNIKISKSNNGDGCMSVNWVFKLNISCQNVSKEPSHQCQHSVYLVLT